MNPDKKSDNGDLFGCGGAVFVFLILTAIVVIGKLVVDGKKGANEIANDDTIGMLRGAIIFLAIIGVVYLFRKSKRK